MLNAHHDTDVNEDQKAQTYEEGADKWKQRGTVYFYFIVLDIQMDTVHCYFIVLDIQGVRYNAIYSVRHTEGYGTLLFHNTRHADIAFLWY